MARQHPDMRRRAPVPKTRSATKAPDRSARYYEWLPPEPVQPSILAARAWYTCVEYLLAWRRPLDDNAPIVPPGPPNNLAERWTVLEMKNIRRLRRRWRDRAAGVDTRWLLVGARGGSAMPGTPDPAWVDPAFDALPDRQTFTMKTEYQVHIEPGRERQNARVTTDPEEE